MGRKCKVFGRGARCVHSESGYQYVSWSAAATRGSVWLGLNTLWSRSAQIATADWGTSGRLTRTSEGSRASASV